MLIIAPLCKEAFTRDTPSTEKSPKKIEENCKKCLTNGIWRGNIRWLSDERALWGAGGEHGGRKSRKRVKKLLTKGSRCDRLNEFPAARQEQLCTL